MRTRLHVHMYVFTYVLTVVMKTVDSFPRRQSEDVGMQDSPMKNIKTEPGVSSRSLVRSPQTAIITFRDDEIGPIRYPGYPQTNKTKPGDAIFFRSVANHPKGGKPGVRHQHFNDQHRASKNGGPVTTGDESQVIVFPTESENRRSRRPSYYSTEPRVKTDDDIGQEE